MVEEKTKKKWELKGIFKDVALGVALGVGIGFLVVLLVLAIMAGSYGVKLLANLANQPVREAQAVATTIIEEKSVGTGEAAKETATTPETTATTEKTVTVGTTAVETVAAETTKGSTVKDVKVYPYIVEEENGVPKNGNSLTISVGFNDLGYASMGPVELFGMKFQGGQDSEGKDIGNITILLGTAGQKTNYTLNSVDNGNVYWKVVRHETAPVQADIDKLMNQGVIDFNKEGNGTSGNGVDKGYIIIANPEGILKTIYFEVENGVIQVMQEVKL